MADLVYRHNFITRFTHWIDAVALVVLFMSGLQIFNAFPQLHWGSKAEPEEAFLSIAATRDDGEVRGTTDLFGAKFDTTGVLGVQNTGMGPSPRAFPSWATIPGYFWLAGGRRWHFFFGWLFVLNGLLYFIFNFLNGHMRKFLFTPRDAAKVPAMILYYLRLRRKSPQDGEYNPLQKMAYTSAFLILTPLVLLTGIAMSPQLNVAFNWLPAVFGGRQSARSIHFILAFAFLFFTFGHVFMVLTTGFFNNMRSMVTGWYREKALAPVKTEESPRVAPAAVASPLTPALSPQESEGEAKTENKDPANPGAAASESRAPEKSVADEKKEP
jgi:Ni/Fe-hydrogenase b-type cytochrome subunit